MAEKLTPAEESMINIIVEHTKRTRDTAEGVSGWGGPRPGAGRPPTGRKSRQIWLSDAEHAAVKQFVKQMRQGHKR